jgi:hypothetical protein
MACSSRGKLDPRRRPRAAGGTRRVPAAAWRKMASARPAAREPLAAQDSIRTAAPQLQLRRGGGSDRRLRCTAARTAGARQLCISLPCGAVHAARERHAAPRRRTRRRRRRMRTADASRQPSAPGLHRPLRCLHAAAAADQAHSAAGALFEAPAAALDIEYREQREVMRHRAPRTRVAGAGLCFRRPKSRRQTPPLATLRPRHGSGPRQQRAAEHAMPRGRRRRGRGRPSLAAGCRLADAQAALLNAPRGGRLELRSEQAAHVSFLGYPRGAQNCNPGGRRSVQVCRLTPMRPGRRLGGKQDPWPAREARQAAAAFAARENATAGVAVTGEASSGAAEQHIPTSKRRVQLLQASREGEAGAGAKAGHTSCERDGGQGGRVRPPWARERCQPPRHVTHTPG